MVGALVMVSGIAVLALMTGMLATGFAEEERRREYLRVWDQVTRVPMFAALGTVTLSEIVSKLRTRHYPPRIVVVRRDEPGDSMFFISERRGRGPPAARRSIPLGEGGFFGEMALLDRLPRSATVVTTQPTTLLVLYASDFYEVAANIPSLVEAVEIEARRRARRKRRTIGRRGDFGTYTARNDMTEGMGGLVRASRSPLAPPWPSAISQRAMRGAA